MTFDPNKTIAARVRRRIVPSWKSRLKDYSTWGIAIALFWETIVIGIWGEYIPPDVRAIGLKVALTFAAVGKFIKQGHAEAEIGTSNRNPS